MTAKIKLNAASGGGSFSLQAPSSSSNNRVFTLPDLADATLLTSNATLGKFASYAIIADQKSSSSEGGVFSIGDWRTRDLNTELSDADGIVSISSNQFTLQAGTYLIEADAPAFSINRHIIKLYQTSGTPADIAFGTSEFASLSYSAQTRSFLTTRVTISSATTYEIRHRCQSTYSGSEGFGVASDLAIETYTVVKIFKEA